MAMTLLAREMFAATGTLTSGAPGSNFSSVVGTLYQRAGGPSVGAGVRASADVQTSGQNNAYTSYGASTATAGQNKLFIGAWFFLKGIGTQGVNASAILGLRSGATSGTPTISMQAIAGRIDTYNTFGGGGVNLGTLPFTPPGWVYLAIAIGKTTGSTYDGRMYYKVPGGALTSFVSWSAVNSFQSSWGSAFFGCLVNNPNINGRIGAPSVYSFANADFSDIAYPSDLTEPTTGLTWYVNPSTGSDSNDGTSAGAAWQTAAKITAESANSGLLAASTYGAGDTLVIDTSGASLDLTPAALTIATQGLNVRAASGQTWITCVPYKTLLAGGWSTTGTANVYSTTDTVALCCVWENDKWLNHPSGANFAAVSAALGSTPGSFWTDGTTLYLHPFANTDPRSDGKVYTRSHTGLTSTAPLQLNEGNLNIQDFYVTKTCDVDPLTHLANGGYCIGNGGLWLGTNLLKHCYTGYSGKHGIGLVANSANGEITTVDTCQCEQGSPYGSQTPFVSFNGSSVTGVEHRYVSCISLKPTGLVGSTLGDTLGEVFYCHNNSGSNQFAVISFADCNFGYGHIGGTSAIVALTMTRTIFGGDVDTGALTKTFTRCLWQGAFPGIGLPQQNRTDATMVVKNCLIVPTATLGNAASAVAGTATIENNTFDLRGATVQGGTSPALAERMAAAVLSFRNNAVIGSISNVSSLFKNFVNTDTLTIRNNQIVYNGSVWAKNYNAGAGGSDRSFVQWQALGFDLGTGNPASLGVSVAYLPQAGSALINTGLNVGPLEDYTGVVFTTRNDVGAYEAAAASSFPALMIAP